MSVDTAAMRAAATCEYSPMQERICERCNLLRSAANEIDELRIKLDVLVSAKASEIGMRLNNSCQNALERERAAHAETKARLESAEAILRRVELGTFETQHVRDAEDHFARFGGSDG